MKKELIELNNARFGSFGEFVFESMFLKNLTRKNFDQADFKWKNKDVDIKSRRLLEKYYKTPSNYTGKKIKDIIYILIEFYKDKVVISKEKKIIKPPLNYKKVEKLYDEWVSYRNKKQKEKKLLKKDMTQLNLMKSEIKNFFFSSKNLNARVIYRTTQEDFGNESPANLLPKNIQENKVTVFLNFNNFNISENNLKEVIAFKDIEANRFDFIRATRLHKKKIELASISKKHKFENIKDLINRWK